VYNSTGNVPFDVNFEGVGAYANGKLTYLTAPMNASSTIGNNVVKTTTENVRANAQGQFSFSLPEYSVAVFEVTAENCGQGYHYGSKSSRRGWQGWKNWGKGPKPNLNQWGQGWW
jgi:alpha-N-arabinofuranosidase